MENHIHLIISGTNIPSTIQSFKSFTAKELIKSLKSKRIEWMLNQFAFFRKKHKKESRYQILQEGYHPKMITHKEILVQKIEYIHLNPVRRGYVAKPEYWQYSSAGKMITGEDGIVEIDEIVW